MAHIEKRPSGRWRARYRTPDGRARSRTFDKRVDAERFLIGIEHSKLTGGYVDPGAGKVTFRTFAEQWAVQLHRPGTAVAVEHQLRLHVYPYIGHRPIAAIRPSELEALVHHLAAKLAPSTVHVIFGRVVSVFRAAVRDRIVTASPCIGIRLPPEKPASLLTVLTTADIHALAGAIHERYAALIMFGAATGLRPGELFGLTKDRVRFLSRTVVVDQQLVRVAPRHRHRPAEDSVVLLHCPVATGRSRQPGRPPGEMARLPRPRTGLHERAGRPRADVPVFGGMGQGPAQGRRVGVGHTSRSSPLLRERAHPIGSLGEGRPGPSGTRLGEDHARRLRPPVP